MLNPFRLLGLIPASLVCGVTSGVAEPPPARPNIIVIYSDDHGYADLGTQGVFKDLKTPHLDALAESGVRATNGYSTAPQCVPSRAGLLSGRYQNRFGVEGNGNDLAGFDGQATIAERLKKAGYETGMAGKWHLGADARIPTHGFDHTFPMNGNRAPVANITTGGKDQALGPFPTEEYHLDACTSVACAFIERFKEKPFFFYLAYRAPHVPLDAPKNYLDRFPGEMPERRRQALAMISAMDDGVGRIVATLREANLAERTLIFFIGDNGAPLKIHKFDAPGGGPGWDGSLNDPMNGEKGMLSEGGIRVPFVVSWPGTIRSGQTYDHPVIALDVAATANALSGLPADPTLDGVNLVPFLKGESATAPHDTLYWRWIAQAAIREGKWKLLVGGKRSYLYDLEADREEKHNLLGEHADIAARLREKLEGWSAGLQPPGIDTKGMSPTWERYFDFYLEGKAPAAPSSAKNQPAQERKQTTKPAEIE